MRLKVCICLIICCIGVSQSNFELYGDYTQHVLPVTSLIYSWNKHEERNTVLNSYFATLGITYLLKFSIDRKRPNGAGLSFPSGHTSAAFVGAYYIDKQFGGKYGTFGYIAAAGVGYSRMYAGKHYFTDVLAGAAIGYYVSWYLDGSRVRAYPSIDDQGNRHLSFTISL